MPCYDITFTSIEERDCNILYDVQFTYSKNDNTKNKKPINPVAPINHGNGISLAGTCEYVY